ncbi:hypothetical protein ABIC09_006853 [Bradyrhizobium sp. S3.12.5]
MSSHPDGCFHPGILTFAIYPDIKAANVVNMAMISMQRTFTAFQGQRRLVSGPAGEVALVVKRVAPRPDEPIIIFEDATGRSIDFDLRGGDREVLARLAKLIPPPVEETASPTEPRGRGRPKLGVVAREVTLLPRHWEWLGAQPGGASVALRKLVDEARRASGDKDRDRQARDAAYHFMSTMAGNLAQFEEASRALFADDRRRFTGLIADWPADIRDHIVKLAYSDRA